MTLIADLPSDRREALILTQIVGLSYAEAAAVCGCPLGTIRSRVARARADLMAALADEAGAGAGA
jgi:RNA polymerase sigma-70 factor (ECF subfamily)